MHVIKSEDGVSEIFQAIYNRDALSTVSDVFHDFYLYFQLNMDTLNHVNMLSPGSRPKYPNSMLMVL